MWSQAGGHPISKDPAWEHPQPHAWEESTHGACKQRTTHLVEIKLLLRGLPDGLVAKAPLSQCRGHRLHPWFGPKGPGAKRCGEIVKRSSFHG